MNRSGQRMKRLKEVITEMSKDEQSDMLKYFTGEMSPEEFNKKYPEPPKPKSMPETEAVKLAYEFSKGYREHARRGGQVEKLIRDWMKTPAAKKIQAKLAGGGWQIIPERLKYNPNPFYLVDTSNNRVLTTFISKREAMKLAAGLSGEDVYTNADRKIDGALKTGGWWVRGIAGKRELMSQDFPPIPL